MYAMYGMQKGAVRSKKNISKATLFFVWILRFRWSNIKNEKIWVNYALAVYKNVEKKKLYPTNNCQIPPAQINKTNRQQTFSI